ncbi:MAG TPA: hypothetical protein PLM07_00875 [Candidatus Rifleibacterium sp.]|nr:hypothetical protein [Candidatus Rifleibacterium sp.]HPT44434.1 hypothetical protein [Candidatus Rifleibacterium sp.]
MTRLSLLLGLFMSVSITGVVMLLAILGNVAAGTIIYRGVLVFFLFGILGTMLGSFLEIVLVPISTEKEVEKLKDELLLEDDQLQAELGDLLDEDKGSSNHNETLGTPTDEPWSGTASNGGRSAAVS